ncbi:MAG: hypothetical protein SOR57_05215 [Parabacteroides sp.]|nr:hypothetical protein [Parabacteroides sp.]
MLTNPVMSGLVKIGMITRDNIEESMKELYGTGVPVPFECKYACKVKATHRYYFCLCRMLYPP